MYLSRPSSIMKTSIVNPNTMVPIAPTMLMIKADIPMTITTDNKKYGNNFTTYDITFIETKKLLMRNP